MARRSNPKRKAISEVQAGDQSVLTSEFVLSPWQLVLIHAAIIAAASSPKAFAG